jgi:hypothetical protein
MPSNRDLKAAAATLGERLGVPVSTTGLGNEALVKLVAELEEQVASAAAVEASSSPPEASASEPPLDVVPGAEGGLEALADAPAADVAGDEPPTDEVPVVPAAAPAVDALRAKHKGRAVSTTSARPPGPYKVAAERSIFCARSGGAGLQGGERVRPRDFDDVSLDLLWRQGAIVKA